MLLLPLPQRSLLPAFSPASGMISINPAPTISVAVTEQDLNFETRLNPIETPLSNWKVPWKYLL